MALVQTSTLRSVTTLGARTTRPTNEQQAMSATAHTAPGQPAPSEVVSARRARRSPGRRWRARLKLLWRRRRGATRWLITQSFSPTWLPTALRRPAVGYGVALFAQVIAVACTTAILLALPHFAYAGLLSVLGIVLTALTFGPGPSLLATFLGALMLNFVVSLPFLRFSLSAPSDVVSFLLYVTVGVAISLIAGQVERGRRVAEQLAAEVATQASQTLALQHERFTHERAVARARVEALEASRRQMDEFLGLASHELRTPLTVAMANMQIVRRQAREAVRLLGDLDAHLDDQPETAWSFPDVSASRQRADIGRKLNTITTLLDRSDLALVRLNRLVSDLLDATRIEAGRFEVDTQPCGLGAALTRAVAEQYQTWPDRAIQVSLPDDELSVHGDVKRLTQVVSILLSNALKFGPPTRPICLRLQRRVYPPATTSESAGSPQVAIEWAEGAVTWARIEVSDDGPGLSPEQQEQVWDRFARIEGIERQEGSVVGFGLGLYIAHAIVERHGGRLGVESARGEGATFWCELPILLETSR